MNVPPCPACGDFVLVDGGECRVCGKSKPLVSDPARVQSSEERQECGSATQTSCLSCLRLEGERDEARALNRDYCETAYDVNEAIERAEHAAGISGLGTHVQRINKLLDTAQAKLAEMSLTPETERRLRQHLWLSHGHQGVYGDDGEMQCGQCAPAWDYKREPLEHVVIQAINARQAVNRAALAALSPDLIRERTKEKDEDFTRRDVQSASSPTGSSRPQRGDSSDG